MPDDELIHVIVPGPRPQRGRLVPHQYALDPVDLTRFGPVAVTSERRTIVDCLGRLGAAESDSLLAWVISRRLLTDVELAAWVQAHPGAWGNARRRQAVERLRDGAASPAEWRLQRLLRAAGITGWRAGESLAGHVGVAASADIFFPDVRLVIEVDGRRFHGDDRFQADRTRQNLLVAAGCTVLRYTWDDIVHRPTAVVAQIRTHLATLRARPRPGT